MGACTDIAETELGAVVMAEKGRVFLVTSSMGARRRVTAEYSASGARMIADALREAADEIDPQPGGE
jgi:hypothetical protein